MWNLIYKEILLQKRERSLIFYLILSVAAGFTLEITNFANALYFIGGAYSMITYANAFDFKYNTEIFFLSLPISRRDWVTAKYLTAGLYVTGSLIILMLVRAVGLISGIASISYWLHFHDLVQMITLTGIFFGLYFPVYFKKGYQKSQPFYLVIVAVLIGAFTLLTTQAEQANLSKAIASLTGLYPFVVSLFLLGATLCLLILSIEASRKIMENKDL